MVVNQSQVDHIISTASADDPEVKMQNLQDEVDLLKKSVKKLLIDIRERMNEMENPFLVVTPSGAYDNLSTSEAETGEAEVPVTEEIPDGSVPLSESLKSDEAVGQLSSDGDLLLSIQDRLGELGENVRPQKPEKLRLQKLHHLFEWTSEMVRKYGHDRLEVMIESYKTMGYITEISCDQVTEIARLMPESLGESHEMSSDEFVSELYVLNRILSPDDKSLDRDMIEVLMEQRPSGDEGSDKRDARAKASSENWIEMLDRI